LSAIIVKHKVKHIHRKLKNQNFKPISFSKTNLFVFALVFAAIGSYALYRSFAATPAITYYVATSGSDTNPGTQSQPFQTITKAASVATSGDTVLVNSGVYHESVSPAAGNVTYRGIGATKPVIDGDNSRAAGFSFGYLNLTNVTIDGFEIRNLHQPNAGGNRAVGIWAYYLANSTFKNNHIHHISAVTGSESFGILIGTNASPFVAHDNMILNNQINNIGPTGTSRGIWMLYNKQTTVSGNTIYMVRQEGIRDWKGDSNTLTSNRLFLNWIGITIETAQRAYEANNYSYNNVFGYNYKHTTGYDGGDHPCPNKPESYDKDANGNLDINQWTRVWHNTAYYNSASALSIGQSWPPGDYMSFKDNIFASNGAVNVWNWPYDTCGHVQLDYNVYSRRADGRPVNDYYTGWSSPPLSLTKTTSDMYNNLLYNDGNTTTDSWNWPGWFEQGVTKKLNYEQHGQDYDMTFNDVSKQDFDYTTTPPQPGVDVGDSYNNQLGARNLPAAPVIWTQYPLKALAASYNGPSTAVGNANRITDDVFSSYWYTSGAPNANINQWITFDLGSANTFQQLVSTVFQHQDYRNVRGYKFEVSDDNTNWRTVLEGVNPDHAGSSYKYELPAPVTARYIKYNMINNFGGSHFIIPDFQVGLISTPVTTTPPPPPPPATKAGDFNSDNLVNITDLSILLSNYGKTKTQSSNPSCDMNNDNIINVFDLSTLLSDYGK
jgi:parallel beta-helix repeat protein